MGPVSTTTSFDLPGPFGAFVSAREIPFPGNGDFGSKRRGSNVQLLSRKAQHLVLTGPFGRQVGEASNAHAVGEPTLDRRSDEIRREKC